MYVQVDRRHRHAVGLGHRERRLPDQIVGRRRDVRGIATRRVNAERLAAPEPACEVYAQGEPEGIETRPQVGAGGRYTQGEPSIGVRLHNHSPHRAPTQKRRGPQGEPRRGGF